MKTCIQTLGILALAITFTHGQDAPAGGGQEKKRPDPEKIFKKLDSDGNGSVSLEELKASHKGQKDPAKAEEVFKKIDADSNGSISEQEFKAHAPGHCEKGGGKGGKGGKGGGKKGKHGGGGGGGAGGGGADVQ